MRKLKFRGLLVMGRGRETDSIVINFTFMCQLTYLGNGRNKSHRLAVDLGLELSAGFLYQLPEIVN